MGEGAARVDPDRDCEAIRGGTGGPAPGAGGAI
jgi:hypothetical protein